MKQINLTENQINEIKTILILRIKELEKRTTKLATDEFLETDEEWKNVMLTLLKEYNEEIIQTSELLNIFKNQT